MQVNVVPYLIDNPSIGFVQARWTFTNPEESYLTKAGLPLSNSLSRCIYAPCPHCRLSFCKCATVHPCAEACRGQIPPTPQCTEASGGVQPHCECW